MKIFKQSADSELFQLHEIKDDEIIALNDICKNYKAYLLHIIKLPDHQLKEFAPGNPDKAKEAMRLQVGTCMSYEIAFNEIMQMGEPKKPLLN